MLEEAGATLEGRRLYAKTCDAGGADACRNAKYADSNSPTRIQTSASDVGFRRIDGESSFLVLAGG